MLLQILWLIFCCGFILIDGFCYFPIEYIGQYAMQTTITANNSVQYSISNITADSLMLWGNCHKKIGNNYIVVDTFSEGLCARCLHLKLRSKNVLQILTSSISQCYTSEEMAESNCPAEDSLHRYPTEELILFKIKDHEGKFVSKEYCPMDGKYTFTYKLNDGSKKECSDGSSSIDSCPGSALNLKYRQCNFGNYNSSFECLGHWNGPRGQKYLALFNKRFGPRYRCAMYTEDPRTGIISLAIGKDSTCGNELYNSTSGYETLELTPISDIKWPLDISYSSCSFPAWMVGNWEHIRITENTITYRDHTTFRTFTIKCASDVMETDKYIVYTKTQCGEEQYNCMRIQKRSHNILEFQLSNNYSKNNDVYNLCDDNNFKDDAWLTQGRVDSIVEQPCPISGEYTGIIPDATYLCANLRSDCRAPELMYYQIFDCSTKMVYEEREYKCIGHWRNDDHLYTYTKRHDISAEVYECFVGSIIPGKEDIYIKEAGEHCQRKIDPLVNGMKLEKKKNVYSCTNNDVATDKPHRSSTNTNNISTKTWNLDIPFPTIPDMNSNDISGSEYIKLNYILAYVLVLPIVMLIR